MRVVFIDTYICDMIDIVVTKSSKLLVRTYFFSKILNRLQEIWKQQKSLIQTHSEKNYYIEKQSDGNIEEH